MTTPTGATHYARLTSRGDKHYIKLQTTIELWEPAKAVGFTVTQVPYDLKVI